MNLDFPTSKSHNLTKANDTTETEKLTLANQSTVRSTKIIESNVQTSSDFKEVIDLNDLSESAISITISEDARLKSNFTSLTSIQEIANNLRQCYEEPSTNHPATAEMYGTFMKLYNIKQEGYKFSYSQLFQFLQVNHDILQMEFTDSKIAFKFTGNQATTDGQEHHLGVRWDLYPNNDRSVFYLKRGLTTSDNNESQSNSSKVGVMSATIQTDEQGVSNEATVGCGAVGADDSLPVGEVGNMFSTWLRISPIPVLISHNESFNIEISETDDMNDIKRTLS
ncbi:unnamed protein product [Ambrosiozyma monospora]|uniref:Unnamed protein product n=1 Tax=Ambrosiozyma monospora TaxID=43982 RepID=A0ACB5SSX5_AMBMO|nr:unnamed protein product [Ambrosiozyma monospora]